MSKSLGNDVSIRNVLDTWGREVALVFFLSGHWRKPIDFTDETLAQAKSQVRSFRAAFAAHLDGTERDSLPWTAFESALDDDFNTPEALAVLHRWRADGQMELARQGLRIFGLHTLAQFGEPPPRLVKLAQERQLARATKDFRRADELRAEIEEGDWEVQDIAEPPGFRLTPR
jgi:cysteinyl-tRNA synthetase